ncbi:hypothetical protein SDC9_192554 [bioreactor metagenome]|uniref:Uncharacterized protein n=1 Tax=bioreactor metagenome TaxID=1076179 RepID=A0A645I129_9ZZZZ
MAIFNLEGLKRSGVRNDDLNPIGSIVWPGIILPDLHRQIGHCHAGIILRIRHVIGAPIRYGPSVDHRYEHAPHDPHDGQNNDQLNQGKTLVIDLWDRPFSYGVIFYPP